MRNDDLPKSNRSLFFYGVVLEGMQHEDDLQSGATHLVLSRVQEFCTRTSRTAIPERISRLIYLESHFLYI